jgi:catechol 2,3-dioxygenase-like lactoylglutathione lyase family enzyme
MKENHNTNARSQFLHIGAAVKDVKSATESCSFALEPLGVLGDWEVHEVTAPEDDLMAGEAFRVYVARARLGSTILEFHEPKQGKSVWYDFIQKKGEGIDHIAFSVEDFDEVIARLKARGIKMLAGGYAKHFDKRRWAYFALDRSGVVIEINERK